MRAPIKWLKDYVEITHTPAELADMLTMAGVSVAAVEYPGQDTGGIVTGKIQSVDPHLGADKLFVCKVDIAETVLTIVTGATNLTQGDVVPVAKMGAKLPSGQQIKETDIRGITSQGMLCSVEELAIDSKLVSAEARAGIFILPPDTPVGINIKEALGLDEPVLEFELTANRADCFSIIGLAREIAAMTCAQLKKPLLNVREESAEKAQELAKITIQDAALCPRYAARIFRDIQIKQSPAWLRHRLLAAGMRPINNVVDVTNFVMLEMGQPLHAFDYNLLARHSIIVRSAFEGEKLTTLDNTQRKLSAETIVIADESHSVGIAGVMGGLATEVTANTKSVLLEAASFKNSSIRKTSRELGLRSEASGRFERGVDVAGILNALDRAAGLLEEMGACKVCQGIIDVYPEVQMSRQITFTPAQINEHLGTDIAAEMMIDFLERLGFKLSSQEGQITADVPSWRLDITCMADISEEVARMYGYDKIPSTVPVVHMAKAEQSYTQSLTGIIKEALTGAGFCETVSFSFAHTSVFDKLNIAPDSALRKAINILNPITDDFPILRTTLTGSLLETAAANLARKNENLKIYEIGAVYLADALPLKDFPKERLMLCGVLTGQRHKTLWNQPQDKVDFSDAKGIVETVLEKLGIAGYECLAAGSAALNPTQISQTLLGVRQHPSLHPGKSVQLRKGDDVLGYIGEIHPAVLDAFDLGIKGKSYLFELSVEELVKHAVLMSSYRHLPKFPAIVRDLAVVLPDTVAAGQVKQAIAQNGGELLTDVEIFDVYAGQQVPQGSKSLAFSLVFRAAGRTLTDSEIDEQYHKITDYLEKNFSAKLRT